MLKKIGSYFFAARYALGSVLGTKKYISLTALFSFLFFIFLNWLPHFSFVIGNFASPKISIREKLFFFFDTFLLIFSSSGTFLAVMSIFISILFAVNAVLLIYFFTIQRELGLQSGGTGVIGAFGGMIGVGCASCGSVIFSFLGLSAAAAILPFQGKEFIVLGIFLLSWSIVGVSVRIQKKGICEI